MITIEIDNRKVLDALQELARRADNPKPALKEIGEALSESTKRRFETTKGPDGKTWAKNSPVTLARKKGSRPLTGETGNLMDTIHWQLVGDNAVEIGSPMEYAATHQFGAKKGEFGRNRRGAPIPWGDIPPRPFLGISDSDETEVLETIQKHLAAAIR